MRDLISQSLLQLGVGGGAGERVGGSLLVCKKSVRQCLSVLCVCVGGCGGSGKGGGGGGGARIMSVSWCEWSVQWVTFLLRVGFAVGFGFCFVLGRRCRLTETDWD